ncbi:hypothetical protein [Polycyclovorans algicola]|uniref:hypothetical protein n=1 Tax=Polycyclovorans algicola TaxID=616992 RepID=UPI001376D01F|nr:hypothetical protein [Polycyclovorans algicola]
MFRQPLFIANAAFHGERSRSMALRIVCGFLGTSLIRQLHHLRKSVHEILGTPTLYNLLGSKGAILYGLLNRTMDQFEAATATPESDDPYDQALTAATTVARVYVQDSAYLRPLWRFELGVIEPEHRPVLMNRALKFWASRLGALARAGRLPKGVGLPDLAREYQIFFAGVLDLWVQNELSDAQLEAQVRYGILLRLLALGDSEEHARLMADLRKTHQRLHAMDA